jgi:hypothetical protein
MQALRVLCEMLNDPVPAVKDTAAWTLGRICERVADTLTADMSIVIQALVQGLNDSPRVGSNCAWVDSLGYLFISHQPRPWLICLTIWALIWIQMP